MWFALAAVIPIAFYFLLIWEGDWKHFDAVFLLLFLGAPVLMAGLCGFLLGSSILDPDETKTPLQAMVYGLMVALLSYLLFFTTSVLILGLRSDDPTEFVIGWALIFMFGFIYVGWLIAMVGAVGGGLLYLYRLKKFDGKRQG
jgi:hypothetical protein